MQARAKLLAATRGDFQFFLRRVVATIHPGAAYQPNWHIDAIGEYLAACAKGEITRLIINLPPRMLKSTVVSVAWPAWLLGQKPQTRVPRATHSPLAIKHSTDCRVVMQRLHREDLSGYLLQKGGWKHLCLPAIAPERRIISIGNFSYTRGNGEPLHEARENLEILERTKRELGSANFSAQYQQAPQKRTSALLKPGMVSTFRSGAERNVRAVVGYGDESRRRA